MGWSLGFDSTWQRDIGYGVPAYCDHPKCKTKIDRGLSYVCGGHPYGEPAGCGLYFCAEHLVGSRPDEDGVYQPVCARCKHYKPPYKAKPDHPEWIHHKATDESWAEWRKENGIK